MGGARGGSGQFAGPHAFPLAASCPQENFDGDKEPSVHFIIPRCELLNTIFARKHTYL